MKPKTTEKQIMDALRDGQVSDDPSRQHGSIEARCAQLEDENRRLKMLVADLTLRNESLKMVAWKKW